MILLSKGHMGDQLTRIVVKNKKNSLPTRFSACGISANMVGTNALYLLHLCGGCGAHAGHLLQLLHAFALFLAPADHLFPMPFLLRTYKDTMANMKKKCATTPFEMMMVETDDRRRASKNFQHH